MRSSNSSRRHITVSAQLTFSMPYTVLSNPDRKKHYDRYGTVDEDNGGDAAFQEFFESMFGGGGGFSMFDGDDDME